MSTAALEGFTEAAEALTPEAVSQYLALSEWQLEARRDGIKEIWSLPGEGGKLNGRIMLPLASDYDDFKQRFSDALLSLGHINDWDSNSLYEKVVAARADLFFVRLDQSITDGTIPFRQGEQTLEALYRMMRAAATTAANPGHTHRGRRPSQVSRFLDEDIRLAHTKKGSFVFTLVTRLSQTELPDHTAERIDPFQRKVTETLARGIAATELLTRDWHPASLANPGDLGLSAGLVESLEDMTKYEGLRSLDLSFTWAAALPATPDVAQQVILDRGAIGGLPRVREYLAQREEPARREMLVGVVKGLAREDGREIEEDTADIILMTEVGGRQRNVHMTLTGEDHEWAIVAYRSKIPFTVTGDLVYERRSWRLVGDLEVDTSFMRHLGIQPDS